MAQNEIVESATRLFLRISLQSLKRSVRVATRMKWSGQYFWLQTCLGFIWKTCLKKSLFILMTFSLNLLIRMSLLQTVPTDVLEKGKAIASNSHKTKQFFCECLRALEELDYCYMHQELNPELRLSQ
ncbi:uncharacterized protein LOC110891429 [Helianthus annuus]|uniref:uncharacterized protein LOC110891429 n=1 Tax=Helianthus annuus TaxID=4232 RepID=UPI001652DB91|nr:uncharacterized protein LOC110891429 [Helianthus annuus]